MPLYEEKLISPLAVRFTQEHIRPVFQCGLELECTIREIKTKPGNGEYDVLLDAPFDAIEIIRWHKRDYSGEEPEGYHWRTFDNRRLYCLQRAAAALWPKKVGAVVQALYAATDGSQRKDSSTTAGRSVEIGHSMKMITDSWAWRATVTGASAQAAADAAFERIARDDALVNVCDLADAPAPPSMLDLFFQGGAASLEKADLSQSRPHSDSEAQSTTDPSSPRSVGNSDGADFAVSLSEGLCGRWEGRKGERFEVAPASDGWTCTRLDGGAGQRKVSIWLDEDSDLLWWGTGSTIYAQASEARASGGQLRWYGNDGTWNTKMSWQWIGESTSGASVAGGSKKGPKQAEQYTVKKQTGQQQPQQQRRRRGAAV